MYGAMIFKCENPECSSQIVVPDVDYPWVYLEENDWIERNYGVVCSPECDEVMAELYAANSNMYWC